MALSPINPNMVFKAVQEWLPNSHVVKTLNLTPAPMMVDPGAIGIVPAIMWVAGNDSNAKTEVKNLLKDLGWEAVTDLGDIEQSRLQESMGLLLTLIVSSAVASQR